MMKKEGKLAEPDSIQEVESCDSDAKVVAKK